jgi:hypothetical protein
VIPDPSGDRERLAHRRASVQNVRVPDHAVCVDGGAENIVRPEPV